MVKLIKEGNGLIVDPILRSVPDNCGQGCLKSCGSGTGNQGSLEDDIAAYEES